MYAIKWILFACNGCPNAEQKFPNKRTTNGSVFTVCRPCYSATLKTIELMYYVKRTDLRSDETRDGCDKFESASANRSLKALQPIAIIDKCESTSWTTWIYVVVLDSWAAAWQVHLESLHKFCMRCAQNYFCCWIFFANELPRKRCIHGRWSFWAVKCNGFRKRVVFTSRNFFDARVGFINAISISVVSIKDSWLFYVFPLTKSEVKNFTCFFFVVLIWKRIKWISREFNFY